MISRIRVQNRAGICSRRDVGIRQMNDQSREDYLKSAELYLGIAPTLPKKKRIKFYDEAIKQLEQISKSSLTDLSKVNKKIISARTLGGSLCLRLALEESGKEKLKFYDKSIGFFSGILKFDLEDSVRAEVYNNLADAYLSRGFVRYGLGDDILSLRADNQIGLRYAHDRNELRKKIKGNT